MGPAGEAVRPHHADRGAGRDGPAGDAWSRGREFDRREAAGLTHRAMRRLEEGRTVLGYAIYTWRGRRRRNQGRDFALHFGQIRHPVLGPMGPPDAEVGKAVTDCLRQTGVGRRWGGDPARPIRVVAGSIRTLAGRPASDRTRGA